jgi:pyruvate dehydrogenase E2 component (dihydrolipoamide acetyltransferase)
MAGAINQEVAMPRLSDSMEEGTILVWHKRVGDEVAVGDELAEIETDKANMAYESDVAGTLLEIFVAADETAAVGAPIARIGDPNDLTAVAGPSSAAPQPAAPERSSTPAPPPPFRPEAGPASNGAGRAKASPLARRIALATGVELAGLAGSGPGGRILKRDVEAAVAALASPAEPAATPGSAVLAPTASGSAETAKGSVEIVELTKLQQVVARRMSESKATAPHFYLRSEVNMGAAVAARARIKAHLAVEGEAIPSFNDMVVKACAIALRKFPLANGAYHDGRFELYSRVNVGIAVAAEGALVVPTIFDADRKGLREIAADAGALAAKVRDGSITPPELSGATFTVSNLGMFGVSSFDAIVNSPQAGILAVGEIADRPAVRGGEVVPAKLMDITLSCDHRILYGAEGAEFLAAVKALLEEPIALAL